MAFLKYAKATLQKSDIKFAEWDALRRNALSPAPDFQKRTAQVILQEYDPSKYMLSHATIVASVDVNNAPASLGKHFVDGFEIDRKYSDYYITPKTACYINNNNDSFERKLLLTTFKTFIGANSYVEHVQIPELSRGRIIDAAARDVGDSIYVDILIANELKHAPLIRAIKNGQLGTLSMGCFVPGSQVTMADGTRIPIEEVTVGDLVITHKGRVREVTNKQIHIGHFNMKQLEIVGVPSAITVTNNHPFFVVRAPAYCACGCGEVLTVNPQQATARRIQKRFKVGHQLKILNPMKIYSLDEARQRKEKLDAISKHNLVEVRADELVSGDLVCFPKVVFEKEEPGTIGKARLLGYFLAEGSFIKRKGLPVEVQFNFSIKEKDTLAAEVIRLLKDEFPQANHPWLQERLDRNTCIVHITGGGVPAWFNKHGGEYSYQKRVSLEVMLWPKELHQQLLGAWLNGDGTTKSDSCGVSGTTTSYALACQLHLLLSRCGVFSRMHCVFEGHSSEIAEAVNGGFSLRGSNGKLAFFTLFVNKTGSEPLFGYTEKLLSTTSKSVIRDIEDYIIFPITSIRDVQYEGPVHNMEVEGDHSYIVEGVAVHNCSTAFTICSKCGNIAFDETQLCSCIRFFKGNEFTDEKGVKRKIAELCGHHTDKNSTRFIEASWVANPAFKGAVLRNILSAEEIKTVEDKMHMAFNLSFPTPIPNAMAKAAYCKFAEGESFCKSAEGDFIPNDENVSKDESLPETEKTKDPIQKAVSDLTDTLREQVLKRVRDEIGQLEVDAVRAANPNKQNESLIKSAMQYPEWRKVAKLVISFIGKAQARRVLYGLILYKHGGWSSIKKAKFTGKEILTVSRMLDLMTKKSSMAGETRVYRTVLDVGGTAPYGDVETYLAACRQVFGRMVTGNEAARLLEKGRLYALGSR
jgi:hypothetical protein